LKVVVGPRAKADIAEVRRWYGAIRPALGTDYGREVRAAIDRIADHPFAYGLAYGDLRRAMLRRFDYSVWYRVVGEIAFVEACLHNRSDAPSLLGRA
jgi:plasmid stabilization system protein ParE